jgi:hypothetical protein
MHITRTSILTGKTRTKDIEVSSTALDAWQNGDFLIQEAMPHLSPSDREFIMTGITDDEWVGIFTDVDES